MARGSSAFLLSLFFALAATLCIVVVNAEATEGSNAFNSFLTEIRDTVAVRSNPGKAPEARLSHVGGAKIGYKHRAIEGEEKCFAPKINHYSPVKNQHLETCCWYDSLTCCSRNVVGDYVPRLMAFLTRLHEELEVTDACYLAVADFICLRCAPDTASFIRPGGKNMTYQIHFCLSFCDKLYDACKTDLNKLPGADKSATNGKELCTAIFHQEGDVQPFVFDDSNEQCFSGVPLTDIKSSHCLPGDKDDNEGDTSTDTSSASGWRLSGLEVAFIVLVPLLVVVIAVMIGLMVGMYLRNRRARRSAATSIYDDIDFSIQLSAFDDDKQ